MINPRRYFRRCIYSISILLVLSGCGKIIIHENGESLGVPQAETKYRQIEVEPTDFLDGTNEADAHQMTQISPCIGSSNPPKGIRLTFSSGRDGNDEIYLLDTDGPQLERLTSSPAHDANPIWSPDGSMIAFLSDRSSESGLMDVYLLVLADQRITRISHDQMVQGSVSWSPDSSQIAYVAAPNGHSYLSVLDIDSGNSVELLSGRVWNFAPVWSPDGRRISFLANDTGPSDYSDLFLIDPDGTDVAQITNTGDIYPYRSPSWSPDGDRITYSANRNDNFDIFTIDLDSGAETRITNSLAIDLFPAWSPDGQYIAYQSADDSFVDIYVMDTKGDQVRRITSDIFVDQIPRWSTDAEFIAFITWDQGWQSSEIRAASANGCGIWSLTKHFSQMVSDFSLAP